MTLRSYSQPFNVGHAGASEVFDGPVVVEEKIDGSQFSFGVAEDGETLLCRSKGAQINVDAPEGMFAKGVETARALIPELTPGWTYRGEYLQKPKHNSLAYSRIPAKHIILFDIDRGDQDYLTPDEKRTEAGRLGLEVVPTLYEGTVLSSDQFKALLPEVSILGGQPAEGIVAKNYALFTPDSKVMMVKYVTESFREVHKGEWRKSNPSGSDFVDQIIAAHRTPARWQKAVQHLREQGLLEGSVKDIGLLMKETGMDIIKECEGDIRDALWAYAWPKIQRGVTKGLPDWYKGKLLDGAFADTTEEVQ